MKKILILSAVLIIFGVVNIFSCVITITPDKSEYKKGDTAIITLTLKQDHSKCIHEGLEPEINVSGLTLLGKTAYTKITSDTYQIKYKVSITDAKNTFNAILECTKGGDKESISVKVI